MFSNADPDLFDSATLPAIRFKAGINNDFSFLSNFYPDVKNFKAGVSPSPVNKFHLFGKDDGAVYFQSAEDFYQTEKFAHVDPSYLIVIVGCLTASQVKKASGKGVYIQWKYERLLAKGQKTSKASIKRDFEEKLKSFPRLAVMREALYLKFTQNPELKAALLATGNRKLEEQGRTKRDWWAHTGESMLGRLLMELRDQLRIPLESQ
jgi:predicted NAD-dependent protein-ADP-ribosyltransferase YbiA (DUF1768 family)